MKILKKIIALFHLNDKMVWGKCEYCYCALAVFNLRNKIAPEVVHNVNGFVLKE